MTLQFRGLLLPSATILAAQKSHPAEATHQNQKPLELLAEFRGLLLPSATILVAQKSHPAEATHQNQKA